ncbi:MAG: hypothetical protein VX619_04025 [bacterium]|nr:hypothetical protein [bacterium]
MRVMIILFTGLLWTNLSVISGKSVSKLVTTAGYSQVPGQDSGNYPPHHSNDRIHRYLYTAFQHGLTKGNMQAQMSSHRFYFDPALNHYYVIMNTPGHSRMQLYFKKSSRYRLVFANFSILEKLAIGSKGYINISVNGQNVISHHSADTSYRFNERTWNIARFVQDGTNTITIELEHQGGKFCLMGAKVETQEIRKGGSNSDHIANVKYVERVFRRVHFRYPTKRESNYYVSLLDRSIKTREQVRRMIERLDFDDDNLDEFESLVQEYFLRYANRQPSSSELRYFSHKLRMGQITLSQLRTEIERLGNGGGNASGDVEVRIRNEFRQVLKREPSNAELRYFSQKIRYGQMTWAQFDEELRRLQNGFFGPGLSHQEIIQFSFQRSLLTTMWWNRLEQTELNLLSLLLQRCNHEILHGYEQDRKQVANQISSRIKTKYPGLR